MAGPPDDSMVPAAAASRKPEVGGTPPAAIAEPAALRPEPEAAKTSSWVKLRWP